MAINPYEADYNAKKAEYDRVKSIVDQASKMNLTDEQKTNLLKSKSKLLQLEKSYISAKQRYDSFGKDPTGWIIDTAGGWTIDTTKPSKIMHIAPNTKPYPITRDWKVATFTNINGQPETRPTVAAAKAYIDAQNPATSGDVNSTIQQSAANLWEEVEKSKQVVETTKAENIAGQAGITSNLEEAKTGIEKNLWTINSYIKEAYDNAIKSQQAAKDLEAEAESLYGNAQIESQYQDLIKKWLNPVKAKQAALYVNLKWKANLAVSINKMKAEYEKTIADLEIKKSEMLVKAAEADTDQKKRYLDQTQEIENNIQWIKNNYATNITGIAEKYALNPLLDVYSSNLKADADVIAQKIQAQYNTSTTETKLAALAKVFWWNRAYVSDDIVNYTNLPFNELVVKAAQLIQAGLKKANA